MATPIFVTAVIRLLTSEIGQLWNYLWHVSSPGFRFLLICMGVLSYRTCVTFQKKLSKKWRSFQKELNKKIEKRDLEVIDTKIDNLQKDMEFVKDKVVKIALAKKN